MEWIRKVETHESIDLEELGYGWVSLDRKLAVALSRVFGGELGRQLTLASSAALSVAELPEEECCLG